ncbi:IS5/IS1182 family transposase, partial [Massilia atriviolacea]
ARWTKKYGKSYYGYKVSANADKRYKLVCRIKVSRASEHVTLHFEEVLDSANTNRNVLADKVYVDGKREERLSEQGWRMHIQRRGSKVKPISAAQERCNNPIAKTRAHGMTQLGARHGVLSVWRARRSRSIGKSPHTIRGVLST